MKSFEELKKEYWVDEQQAQKINKAIRIYERFKAYTVVILVMLTITIVILLFVAIIKFLLWYIF